MVPDDSGGQGAAEVVLLDEAFFQCSVGVKEFLNIGEKVHSGRRL